MLSLIRSFDIERLEPASFQFCHSLPFQVEIARCSWFFKKVRCEVQQLPSHPWKILLFNLGRLEQDDPTVEREIGMNQYHPVRICDGIFILEDLHLQGGEIDAVPRSHVKDRAAVGALPTHM